MTFDCEEERRVHYKTADAHILTYCHLCGRHCHDGISLVRHQVHRHDYLDDRRRFSGDNEASQEWQSYYESRYSSFPSVHQKSQKWHEHNKEEPQQRSDYGDQFSTDEWNDPLGDFFEAWQKQEQARKGRLEQQEQKREKKGKYKAKAFWDDFNFENIKDEWGSQSESSEDEQGQQQKQKEEEKLPFPDHYATLNVSRNLLQPEMEKAAKRRRIEVHPDKLSKLTGLSPEERVRKEAEAKEVGCAADVLSVAESRQQYDKELLKWEA